MNLGSLDPEDALWPLCCAASYIKWHEAYGSALQTLQLHTHITSNEHYGTFVSLELKPEAEEDYKGK